MRWLADECVSAPLVRRLRDAGHDVLYMAEAAIAEFGDRLIGRYIVVEAKRF